MRDSISWIAFITWIKLISATMISWSFTFLISLFDFCLQLEFIIELPDQLDVSHDCPVVCVYSWCCFVLFFVFVFFTFVLLLYLQWNGYKSTYICYLLLFTTRRLANTVSDCCGNLDIKFTYNTGIIEIMAVCCLFMFTVDCWRLVLCTCPIDVQWSSASKNS